MSQKHAEFANFNFKIECRATMFVLVSDSYWNRACLARVWLSFTRDASTEITGNSRNIGRKSFAYRKFLQNSSSETFCQLTFIRKVLFVNFNFIEKNNNLKSAAEHTRKLANLCIWRLVAGVNVARVPSILWSSKTLKSLRFFGTNVNV